MIKKTLIFTFILLGARTIQASETKGENLEILKLDLFVESYAPFQRLAEENNMEGIDFLMQSNDVSLNAKKTGLRLALNLAATKSDQLSMVETILQKYSEYVSNPCASASYFYAIRHNYKNIVKTLLTHQDSNPFEMQGQWTPLGIAQREGHQEMAQIIQQAQQRYIDRLNDQKRTLEERIQQLQALSNN